MTLKTCEREKDKTKTLGQKRIQTVHQYFYPNKWKFIASIINFIKQKEIKNLLLQRIHSIENFDRQEMIGQRHIWAKISQFYSIHLRKAKYLINKILLQTFSYSDKRDKKTTKSEKFIHLIPKKIHFRIRINLYKKLRIHIK